VDEQELQRKAELAELLLEAARRLGESLEPDSVYDRFHELLADVVPHDAVVVSAYDEREELIHCEYAWVEGALLDPAIFPPVKLNRTGGGMQSQVIVTGTPLIVNDVAAQVQQPGGTYYDVDREGTIRKLPESGPPGTRAVMMAPIKHRQRVVGVVQLMSDHEQYDPHELELFSSLVGQMGASVRNARLQKERVRLEAAEAAARAAASEREQAAHVLDVVGDGIFLVDEEGAVRLWNRAAEVATGVSSSAILGYPAADAFPEWDTLASRIPVAEGGASARSVTLPVDARGRDLWLSFVAVRGAEGVVYAFRDLTNERRLDEERSDFIATISHELRTPMAAVYGAAQTLLLRGKELDRDQARQLLEMIATQAARLTHITEEVLLASRLDRGDIHVTEEEVDVAELTRATVRAMRSNVPEAAEFDIEVEGGVGPASGDADRIQQVLVNLLDNAVKYGGGSRVAVRVGSGAGGVRITVADEGPGIAHAEQERIFEKFYRADPHLKHSPGGTGLGLYISRELVQRMGGRLGVDSEPGHGAAFVVELPTT
jgi:two-component system, OmpR family, phosphate regulon sensor histidine kinase PhoR